MDQTKKQLEIISPVFRHGQPLPPQYSGSGSNVNPPLNIFGTPKAAQSLTLIMHDPDAPSGDFLHWLVWDIPPSTESIGVNSLPVGAIQGQNDMGQASYFGPAPPPGSGVHHYIFDVYALDTTLDLPSSSNLAAVKQAMTGHIIAEGQLTGTFGTN